MPFGPRNSSSQAIALRPHSCAQFRVPLPARPTVFGSVILRALPDKAAAACVVVRIDDNAASPLLFFWWRRRRQRARRLCRLVKLATQRD